MDTSRGSFSKSTPSDINEEIAKRVFNFHITILHHPDPVFLPEIEKIMEYYDGVNVEIIKEPLPDFDCCMDDAMRIVDKMRELGWHDWNLHFNRWLTNGHYVSKFYKLKTGMVISREADADNPAEAICKSALLALNEEK